MTPVTPATFLMAAAGDLGSRGLGPLAAGALGLGALAALALWLRPALRPRPAFQASGAEREP